MDDPFFVDLLDPLNKLNANQEARLQVKSALASREQVFKRWTKQVHHHHMEMLIWCRTVRANVV